MKIFLKTFTFLRVVGEAKFDKLNISALPYVTPDTLDA
jgi:hypothetical protein